MMIGKYLSGAILTGCLGIGLIPFAYADGSVSFTADITPMMKARPFFERFITQSFTVADTGWGTRIDSPTMPHMGGARMGPYRFNAIWHSQKGDIPVTLIIDTNIKFFDANHREITGSDLRKATSIKETLDSIEIEPPRDN
ncbi:hypothetical protein FAZ69_29600 [Trinickia terrae]|uniref:Uncharacterized protein n=1 Tax=Trinickia terrae TaxID=2571161 RepID=A0A4U1HKQ8_9BURK|nr:hypothetical protein [Trinickia terrae]TKC80207.1 hypothetical protein FAZ69_29600 [Trinickia terrae]